HEPALYFEFLVVLAKGLHDLRRGGRILEAPGDPGHSPQGCVEVFAPGAILDGLLDEGGLDDPVLDSGFAELVPQRADLCHRHPGEIEEDGRGHLVEAPFDVGDRRGFFCALHQPSSSVPEITVSGSIRTPGPMVELTMMLRR